MGQAVKHLPSKCEALSSNSNTTKKFASFKWVDLVTVLTLVISVTKEKGQERESGL
jgi:hypothetical protein